jgi:phosphoribosyl 1,2-cyclic phosphodiesterase
MSLSFCVLGSGSAGNCTLIICHDGSGQRRCFLIDAGISPRATALRLRTLGIHPRELNAILLTHLDQDHFYTGWLKAIEKYKLDLRLCIHHRHRNVAWKSGLSMRRVELFKDGFQLDSGPAVRSTLLAHDDLGSVGFVVEHDGLRLGYATDLGRVPDSLLDHFDNLHALAIESNYDRQMQIDSGRPWFLKRRIMGGEGHLSNEQSLEAVQSIAGRCGLSHIALLHLSRECNHPRVVRKLYWQQAPHLLDRVTITDQFEPTPMLCVHANARLSPNGLNGRSPRQLSLFDGIAGTPASAAAS